MPDTAPAPIEFPVQVTVNGVRVEIVLLLRPGTQVAIKPDPDKPRATSTNPNWPLAD